MEKQNAVFFRSSPAGYNKRDVNQFILDMNAKYSASEDGYKKEIAELKENEHKNMQAVEKLSEAESEIAALRIELESVRLELNEIRRENEALAAEKAATVPNDPDELEQLRKKAALYDTMSSQFGDVMLTASHNAEKMLSDARREAEQTLDTARSTIGQGSVMLSARLDDLYRSASVHAIDEIQSAVSSAQKALNRFLDDFSQLRAQLDETLRQHDNELRRAADEEITQMRVQGKAALEMICAKKTRPSLEEDGK